LITGMARVAGLGFYWLDARSRHTALDNLRAVYGESMTLSERKRLARASAMHFTLTFFDLFWARHLTKDTVGRWYEFENLETIQRLHAEGGVIGVCMHFGQYELAAHTLGFQGILATMIARDFKNPALTDLMTQAREVSGHRIVPREGALRRLIGALREGRSVGIVVDLALKMHEGGFPMDCLGLKLNATSIHGALHRKTGRPVVPITSEPLPGGRWLVRVHDPLVLPMDSSADTIAQSIWDFFEPIVRARPELWLWCYRHFRYYPEGESERYPSYAHGAEEWDRKIALRDEDKRVRPDPAK